MADGDDLPDGDYESIYGREAMHRRLIARLDATLRSMDAMTKERLARVERRVLAPDPDDEERG